MIIKKYAKSEQLKAMRLLLNRLPSKHPFYPKLATEIQTTMAGDYGEEMVYRELERMRLPYNYFLLHKVMLRTEKLFEIDFLLLTPFGAVILEIKNIIGLLEFKVNPSQIIQTKDNGEIKKYPCPVNQLNEYSYLLSNFFTHHNLTIPVFGAIVFASKNSHVKTTNNDTTILYKNEVYSFLRNLQNKSTIVSVSKLNQVKNLILKHDSPFEFFPLTKHYSIEVSDLISGVACEGCGQVGMNKIKNIWYCTSCQYADKYASLKSLQHYFWLYDDILTNKACRQFLLLDSRYEVKRLLRKANLLKLGKYKTTQYKKKN
ncbi:nuclease-related domain-containing protein [Psychrobacillus sp. MER TA 171]|uniref:nuclease-related domain-containing protein n=1 Tax=Psychrobacillus sp. MER TA 171 TaxID=2939577 RepID=UPI002040DC11|nr:nuclease-related domain-containing protein [Psychrobacillus sp. MER TA 171]MCM3359634.1 NERD domain-containing protein [Psychrobacillus sp. MER TA 171]